MKKTILMTFTQKEMDLYNDIKHYAKKRNRTPTNYCKTRLQHNIELEKIYDKDIEKKQPSEEFTKMMEESMEENKNILKRLAGK